MKLCGHVHTDVCTLMQELFVDWPLTLAWLFSPAIVISFIVMASYIYGLYHYSPILFWASSLWPDMVMASLLRPDIVVAFVYMA